MQIQALLAATGETGEKRTAVGSNIGPHIEVAKLAIFNGEAGKVKGFVTVCRLFLRIRMREAMVEEQVNWVLSYI